MDELIFKRDLREARGIYICDVKCKANRMETCSTSYTSYEDAERGAVMNMFDALATAPNLQRRLLEEQLNWKRGDSNKDEAVYEVKIVRRIR